MDLQGVLLERNIHSARQPIRLRIISTPTQKKLGKLLTSNLIKKEIQLLKLQKRQKQRLKQ